MILSPQNLLGLLLGVIICSQAEDTCPDVKLMGVGDSDKLAILRGCPGIPGHPGLQGPPGSQGAKGDKGAPGSAGKVGPPGQNGNDGAPGKTGDRGEKGVNGAPGKTGDRGEKGDRGDPGRTGLIEGKGAKNCKELKEKGIVFSGWYTIYPEGMSPLMVLCDMVTDGGGWIVFQRRFDGSVDFYRDWSSYQMGFGNQWSEFWLGNENLHRLTASGSYELRFDLEDFEGNRTYATYSKFRIEGESSKYILRYDSYTGGTAGDSLRAHKDRAFSTKDQRNDKSNKERQSCAEYYKGAWWYNACHDCNLNGEYLKGSHTDKGKGIIWNTFRGNFYSLKSSEMKFRPVTI